MRILFIGAFKKEDGYALNPPLGPLYLISYLKKYSKKEHEIRYIVKDYEKIIPRFKPDIVAISSVSPNFNIAKKIAKFSKMHKAITIIGGIHISVLSQSLDSNMDIGVIGEGEHIFLEIVEEIEKNGFNKERIKKIRGVVIKDKGRIYISPPREQITDIDSIPIPDRRYIEFYDVPNITTSRGCPYNCSFCIVHNFWKTVRFHSAEYVIKEIKSLLKNNIKHITINDDLFTINVKRLERLVYLIKKEGIEKKVSFDVAGRANVVNDKILKLLKEMNVNEICYGFESGSPEMLKFAKGENVTVEDNKRAIKLTKKHGITCKGFFIIGFPEDTEKTIDETYRFIKENKPDFFEVYVLTPFPGTVIWDDAKKRGFVTDYMNWDKLENRDNVDVKKKIILTKKIDRKKVELIYRKFKGLQKRFIWRYRMNMFLNNPDKIVPFLRFKIKEMLSLF